VVLGAARKLAHIGEAELERLGNASASQKYVVFEAQWLAYALPYRRFTPALAGDGARLGADVVRYSFIAVDLHHLLLAGLPGAHPSYG
jgi:hypothetical protein